MDDMIDAMHDTPPANPDEPVLVAGEPEAAERARRLRAGIPISAALAERLRAICERAGTPYLLDPA
jgi:LDH2 family malate/lactate/ureidoglycolate dehydrogenase